MPQTTTSPITPALTAVFSDEALTKAAELAADSYRPVWVGPSGEESSGESVALHLEATIALLDKDGWIRTYDHGADWSTGVDLPDDDSMTVKQMLQALLRFIRDESSTGPERTLASALTHIGVGGEHGDPDTASVAADVMNCMIQAHTGSVTARATSWSERKHRTLADVTALLTASARFARLHGPTGQEAAAA
ncbi:DUF6197 family protein [Streptomyces clavifer]|uniref:DUF6197 family protein n=1 Tax=Streptomyces clavifer TaxID=68188 RepID=UPI0038063595